MGKQMIHPADTRQQSVRVKIMRQLFYSAFGNVQFEPVGADFLVCNVDPPVFVSSFSVTLSSSHDGR
jgi:hypothetical protein